MTFNRATIATGLVMAGFTILLIYAFLQLQQIQKTLSTYLGENMLWAIAQTEREARRLNDAVPKLATEQRDAEELSLRFDVLYSRLALLIEEPQRSYFRKLGAEETINHYVQSLAELETLLDAPTQDFNPLKIHAELAPMIDDLQRFGNYTMIAERDAGGMQRDQQLKTIYLIMTAIIGLMVTGAVMSWQLISNMREAARANLALQKHKEQLEQTVTERTAALREALQTEKQAKEIYKSFITTVSHQFRTPVSIIDMIAQRFIRRSEAFPPEIITEKAKRIRTATRRLVQLLESTANAERLEGDEIQLSKNPTNFAELVHNACAYHLELFPEQQININTNDTSALLNCDGVLVEQIIVNLLANAGKYSPPDMPIDVIIQETATDFLCSVEDRGIGIPDADSDKIFTRFYRASNVSHMVGTGLGLSLSRTLTEFHSGKLTFRSREGEGSVFTLKLPKEASHEQA